jgi:hypothetical protein
MSRLLELQGMLQDTSAAIAHAEAALLADPKSRPVATMLKSIEKRKQQLEAEFQAISEETGVSTCSYRFFDKHVRPTVSPLCSSLINFQSLYSIVYDAVISGPKKVKRLSAEILDHSSLFFGYTFSGSVGVVLTLSKQQRELFAASLDESAVTLFDLASSKTSEEVLTRGRIVGVPAVRALHKWATTHVESKLGADIQWKRGRDVMGSIVLDVGDLKQLIAAIDSTTDIIEDDDEVVGKLAGADVDRRLFHLILSDGRDIKGTFHSSIPLDRTFEVGRTHRATIRKKVKVYYSTEQEEDVSYQLLTAVPVEG